MRGLQDVGDKSSFSQDLLIYAAGPAEAASCREFTDAFSKRFAADPRQFDVFRDGVEFMQHLRRNHPRKFDLTERPAVGGFITHTAISRDGLETSVIHEWPDLMGRPIDGAKPGLSIDGINHCPARRPTPTEHEIA
jgi:hypothetical protein